MSECVWKLKNLEGGFNTSDYFEDVSFEIHKGERVAFLGSAKSGRKLLLRVMSGLRPARAGTMCVLDYEVEQKNFYQDWDNLFPREIRSKIGVSLEVDGLLSNVTIREGFELLFRFRYGDFNERLQKAAVKAVSVLCKQFDLEQMIDKRPVELSASERKLAALARTFLTRPKVILMENPSEAVGQLSQKKLWMLIDSIFDNPERTLILSTEDFRLAWRHCPRWIVFDQGKIIFDGRKEDFINTKNSLLEELDTHLFPT